MLGGELKMYWKLLRSLGPEVDRIDDSIQSGYGGAAQLRG